MISLIVSRAVLIAGAVLASLNVAASGDQELQQVAFAVAAGREMAHALQDACAPHYRDRGFDPRFFVFFWDTARFDIYEGARATIGSEFDSELLKEYVKGNMPHTTPRPERCDMLVLEDTPQHRLIPGVSEENLQRMHDRYLATNPDPHVLRDKSLLNDCMKANFNSRRLDFDRALQSCNCTLSAMHSVPDADLDNWLARTNAGADVPMATQPWFPALLPKLMACVVQ